MNTTAARQREVVFAFMETAGEPDLMGSTEELGDWLVAHGLLAPGAPVSNDDFRLARRVRASLFALLVANSGGKLDTRVSPSLAAVTELAPLQFRAADDGTLELAAGGSGVPRALAELVAVLYRATIAGEFPRWKVCRKCAWPFFDASKNRSRVWCDMQLCGSQEKAKHYRQRRAAAAG